MNTHNFKHNFFGTEGFRPDKLKKATIWGAYSASVPTKNTPIKNLIYLGNTGFNTEGEALNNASQTTDYPQNKWGNPFYKDFITNNQPTFLLKGQDSTKSPIQYMIENKTKIVETTQHLATRFEETVIPIRYNPNKDKGIGNIAYFLRTDNRDQNSWDPPRDEELIIKNFPLWLMLWGYEDYVLRHKKINNLDVNGILVIRSDYFSEKLPAYILLSDDFVNGLAPYGDNKDEMNTFELGHWYP